MLSSLVTTVCLTVAVLSTGCMERALISRDEGLNYSWTDGSITFDLLIQDDLNVVATIVNRTVAVISVPRPIMMPGRLSVESLAGDRLSTTLDNIDWFCDQHPIVEIPPLGSHSQAISLSRAYPSLAAGTFVLRLRYDSPECDMATWNGEIPEVRIQVDTEWASRK